MEAFIHESSFVDKGAEIGAGTKVWHFCHIQSGASIGKNCTLGQNVNIASNVHIGDGVKLQNNVIRCTRVLNWRIMCSAGLPLYSRTI